MRIKRHSLSKFSDLGTAVLYPTRTFHIEVQGLGVSNPEKVIEKASSNTFLYSAELNSEYIDFAKYNFDFDLPETKYWSSLVLNQYDYEDTVSKFGGDFDTVAENLVPQLMSTKDTKDKHFFGRLANSENTIFLINIPSEINTLSSTLDPRSVWKVEFYNSRLSSNNTLTPDVFVDYDVLSVLNPESIIEKPVLSVYFGPSWDVQIQDYLLDETPDEYLSRYRHRLMDNNSLCLSEDVYGSFTEYMSKSDYIKSVSEEIESEKLLYIINTTDGDIKTIDMFSAAYSESDLKYRNQNENILRNDETKDYQLLEKKGSMVFDSRSSTLLGIGGDTNDCPLLRDKLSQLSKTDYSTSSECQEIIVSGKTYIRPKNQEIFGENPEISPYWIAKDYMKESVFNHFYVTTSGMGETKPGGLVYLRKGKKLELEMVPEKGHKFKELLDRGYDTSNSGLIIPKNQISGDRYEAIFEEIKYTFNLSLSCNFDYPEYGVSNTYSLAELRAKNINLWYYDPEQDMDIMYTGGALEFTYSNPLKFWIDTEDSLYYIPDAKNYFFLEDSSVSLSNGGKYTTLSIEKTPQRLLGNATILSVIGQLNSKQYTVTIETSEEIQVSTKKKLIFEYGDEVEIKFAYEGDKKINVTILDETTGKEVLSPWTKSTSDDGIVTVKISKRTKKNPGYGIKSNYKIIAGI